MDMLLEAFIKRAFSEAYCNEIINHVKSKGSKLSVDTIVKSVQMKGKKASKTSEFG